MTPKIFRWSLKAWAWQARNSSACCDARKTECVGGGTLQSVSFFLAQPGLSRQSAIKAVAIRPLVVDVRRRF